MRHTLAWFDTDTQKKEIVTKVDFLYIYGFNSGKAQISVTLILQTIYSNIIFQRNCKKKYPNPSHLFEYAGVERDVC